MKNLLLALIAGLISFASTSYGVDDDNNPKEKAQILRVGGDYLVQKIIHNTNGTFTVIFKAKYQSKKGNTLRLETDHINMNIREGEELHMSAEILDHSKDIWEVSQVVLFIPRPEGPTPVWVLSNKSKNLELNATDYLKMHYPQSDFMIF